MYSARCWATPATKARRLTFGVANNWASEASFRPPGGARPPQDGRPRTVNTRYRRKLDRRFPKKAYGQRWQIEATFSMLKRHLGSALTRRKPWDINREVLLRVITHNLMIIKRVVLSFQQSMTVPIYCSLPA